MYVVKDDIEYAFNNPVPLWMFGFLYQSGAVRRSSAACRASCSDTTLYANRVAQYRATLFAYPTDLQPIVRHGTDARKIYFLGFPEVPGLQVFNAAVHFRLTVAVVGGEPEIIGFELASAIVEL